MKTITAILLFISAVSAKPVADSYASDYAYFYDANKPVVSPAAFPPLSSQFHAQDEFGQYNYGYSNEDSAKSEYKTADGVTRGSYSYIDANGIVQTVNYISDALGFRVAATNLPVHNVADPKPAIAVKAVPAVPEVVPAVPKAIVPQEPLTALPVSVVRAAHAGHALQAKPSVLVPSVAYSYLPYATSFGYNQFPYVPVQQGLVAQPADAAVDQVTTPTVAPVVTKAQPAPVAASPVPSPVGATQYKYHAQDELGQYNFGYGDPNSARSEVKTADGVVRGTYNYVDSDGIVQTVRYQADAAGFRVAGTNIPVANHGVPVAVADTPEVVAAREEHFRLVAEIQAEQAKAQSEAAAIEAVAKATSAPIEQPLFEAPVEIPAPVPAVLAPVEEPTPVVKASVPAVPEVVVPAVNAVPTLEPVIPVATAPVAVPAAASSSQFHAQDEIGQYNYGYANQDSTKVETKTADGVVRGTYTYLDANGQLQRTDYISDALGFRVAATNLPVHEVAAPVADSAVPVKAIAVHDVPEVKAIETAPVVEAAAPKAEPALATPTIVTPTVGYSYLPYATNYGYTDFRAVPVQHYQPAATAAVAPSPQSPVNTQFHAQDEAGQYNYGYSNGNSAKSELRTADGVVRGSYSYIDANGVVQRTDYISDALGFRVAATNLPEHVVGDSMIEAQVGYKYLPYAVNHPYYF